MTVLLYVLGVLIFFGAILTSIGLHELGHMIPAKKFGGKVTQYFVGFGPTVWSKQIGETEYGVKAIPLGGYVKIVGMLPPAAADLVDSVEHDEDGNAVQRVRKSNTGMFTQLISDARAAEWELVKPEDSDRLFYKMASWKKVVVMAGGPTVNLLIAFFLFWGIFAIHGVEGETTINAGQPVISEVSECLIPYAEQRTKCEADDPKTPAYEIGLRPGDTVTEFNGVAITGWTQLRDLIRDNAEGDAVITYERDGQVITGTTSTTVQARPDPTRSDDKVLTQVGFLGVTPSTTTPLEKGGPLFTLGQMGHMTVDTVKAIGTLPVKVYGVGEAVLGLQERAADSPVSIVGGGRFAGETTSDSNVSTENKVLFLILLVAGFNLFIGLFNFVPLLPLDGGHIASALWEATRRRLARLRRRPDPGYVDAARLLPIAYVVASVMLVMGVVLILGDLVAPVERPL
ncbi:RIP metalloprotease [Nocardioides sp.]|uniref:M50 family metallopeptidase n=1 Tax=Nocardioides sp. TaxID=35761 RepID=UPI002727221E|nr:site-2 protease family protein [Nocardioides sp.]MDO9457970.1 site-2 protease family protein [Nocardioides sp.]